MPYIDEGAKAWELELSRRVGDAVMRRRKALGLTAVQLADRTRELHYPITRVAITKIETNKRAGKLDVAELVVIAVALEIPPALLLVPDFPDDKSVELLPSYQAQPRAIVRWLCGEKPLPLQIHADDSTGQLNPPNAGTELVGAYARKTYLEAWLGDARLGAQATPDELAEAGEKRLRDQETLAAVEREIARLLLVLWGQPSGEDSAADDA
jgi:transcriptional regulator with XRE-family HTH domain